MQDYRLISIRDYRKNNLKITQVQACNKLGISRGQLSKFENHPEQMTFEEYAKISRHYGFVCPTFF